MEELQVINKVGRIEWNIEAFREGLTGYVQQFKDLVVTEDNLKDMERSQKILASVRIKLDKFRKATKAEYEKPLKVFEMEVKTLQDIIADAETPLNDQLKKYELNRVNAERLRLKGVAQEFATSIGLRDEYFFNFSVKNEWVIRTAPKGKTVRAIQENIEQIKQQQDLDDRQKEMDQLKQQQIEMLCQTNSELYGLNTPITAQDCQYETKTCELKDLPNIVKSVAQKRADVEREMMKTIAPAVEPAKPKTPAKVNEAPIQKVFNVNIQIKNLPESRLAYLKEQLADIRYEIIENEVR